MIIERNSFFAFVSRITCIFINIALSRAFSGRLFPFPTRSILYASEYAELSGSCTRYSRKAEIRRSGATTSQNCVFASQSRLVFRVWYQSPRLHERASAELECTPELDRSRRGGSRRVPNIISQRAVLGASRSKEPLLRVFPFSSPPSSRGRTDFPPAYYPKVTTRRTLRVARIAGDPGRRLALIRP